MYLNINIQHSTTARSNQRQRKWQAIAATTTTTISATTAIKATKWQAHLKRRREWIREWLDIFDFKLIAWCGSVVESTHIHTCMHACSYKGGAGGARSMRFGFLAWQMFWFVAAQKTNPQCCWACFRRTHALVCMCVFVYVSCLCAMCISRFHSRKMKIICFGVNKENRESLKQLFDNLISMNKRFMWSKCVHLKTHLST